MSEVWLAEDAELERKVALKLLATTADRARFQREARAAASLAHENVMQLYDFGEAGERPFMVLEYLGGGTLADRLPIGSPLPDDETRRIATDVAAGLAHAHSRGLVHRDLKPANVVFDDEGRAKIADFGVARIEGGATLTDTGTILGTAAYLSPEQAAGGRTSPASDVYAFGVLLFRMLTGRLPFDAPQALDLLALHRDAEPPPVHDVRPDAPFALAALADDALAKNPQARPQDGRELLARLAPSTAVPPGHQVPPPEDVTQVIRPHRRRRGLPLAAAAVIGLAAAGAGAAYELTSTAAPPAAATTTQRTGSATLGRVSTHRAPPTTAAQLATTAGTTAAATTTHEPTTQHNRQQHFGTTTYVFTPAPPPTEPTTTTVATTTPETVVTDTTAATTTG
jgi:serine/threonine-protein kinase